ncbi:MAG: hypothetical protein WBW33_17115 [Bryobacteraceae bacterium]|jgi:hypothetical protein
MNEYLPFLWRKYYRNEATSSKKVLEVAPEQARQYLISVAISNGKRWRSYDEATSTR